MTKKINLIVLFAVLNFVFFGVSAQTKNTNSKVANIEVYNNLIDFLPTDSVRHNNDGSLVEGWKEDHYPTGKPLHKGFYKKGKLLLFKNFYENGLCERSLNSPDPLHHEIDLFYENGNVNKQTFYYNSNIKKVCEFYSNSIPKSKIEYDKEGKFIVFKLTWFPNGALESELKLIEPKSKKYSEKHYYDNGFIKEEGNLLFSLESKLYKKNGIWNLYDNDGKNKKSVNFN